MQTSASTDADIRVDRCRHPRRPLQTSASTVADIRVDRCRHPHRPSQTSAPTDADALPFTYTPENIHKLSIK
ncbi:hypothetical protein [Leyella stercorea]|uniref:hypothetical protein n=1 Tax=Leyella stercorea TaxID=363265 RepID=UPI00266BA7B7|nr:hypothetical protein [Leyella stercorea]